MRNSFRGADGFQNDPFHKIPEQQSTRSCESPQAKFPCMFSSFLHLCPGFWAEFKPRDPGLRGFVQHSHFHVLLTQEIKETFPGEDGCDEQVISALHPHSS